MNIYNEIEPYAVEWLKNLVVAGLLPHGEVNDTPVQSLDPRTLERAVQFHTFCGIGGWPLALELAGWPVDREVWTGSCPCQPFSVASPNRKGVDDERHLWPAFRDLIAVHRPATIFGEQVASKDGRSWLVGVRSDLEALGYEVGAADLCAAGTGAPHIRQRLYWVADLHNGRREGASVPGREWAEVSHHRRSAPGNGGMVDAAGLRGNEPLRHEPGTGRGGQGAGLPASTSATSDRGLGHPDLPERGPQAEGRRDVVDGRDPGRQEAPSGPRISRAARGAWDEGVWIPCADGKARRLEPGIAPLAHGVPGRVGKIRAYGGAIVPQLAAQFIEAYLDVRHSRRTLSDDALLDSL